jgi:non-ribosomal peptide synthetase component F
MSERCTQFVIYLAAMKASLHCCTRSTDILVRAPFSTRVRPALNRVIGCFVHDLILRTELSTALTYRQLLRRVRETVYGAFDHAWLSDDMLMRCVWPAYDLDPSGRDLASTALRQAQFNFFPDSRALQERSLTHEPGWDWYPLPAFTRYDVTLSIRQSRGGPSLEWMYPSRAWRDEDIQALVACYEIALSFMASDLDRKVTASCGSPRTPATPPPARPLP